VPPAETATGQAVVPAAELPRTNISGLGTQVETVPTSESARNVRELGSTAVATPPRLMRDQPYMTSAAPGVEPEAVTIGGGGTLRTENADMVRNHIGRLNEIIDSPEFADRPAAEQEQIKDARTDAQRQMAEYHEMMRPMNPNYGRPHFPQLDIPSEVSRIGSYTEAADHLQDISQQGYNYLNDLSGGRFSVIERANRVAWGAVKGATTVQELENAEAAVEQTNKQMNDLLDKDIVGAVSPKELQGFRDAYGQSQKLRYVGKAVDGAFDGNPSTSTRSWQYRGFDGNRLAANLQRLEQRFGYDAISRTVGRDNLEALHQVADLNRTLANRGKFGAVVNEVNSWLQKSFPKMFTRTTIGSYIGYHLGGPAGATAGAASTELAWMATKATVNKILSNPRIAQNVQYAIEKGIRPEVYGPAIGSMIVKSISSDQEEQPQQ
jgi:hypothetical protein